MLAGTGFTVTLVFSLQPAALWYTNLVTPALNAFAKPVDKPFTTNGFSL
jgi:hypothetical protein